MKKLSAVIALIVLLGASAAAHAAEWTDALQAAIRSGNFNQVNIIAASHPEAQGAIALFLLERAEESKDGPVMQVKIFAAATPFVGRISAADIGKADDAIGAIVKFASDPGFQKSNPREAGNIFLSALLMSSQPNIVANDPNLHAEVLEAADDFVKQHPEDADKRLEEEVSLAEAGGAPETTPVGVINPSAE